MITDEQKDKDPLKEIKKHCHNCKCLYFYDKGSYEDNSPEGWYCDGRKYKTDKQEGDHLSNLQRVEYRLKSKICFVL